MSEKIKPTTDDRHLTLVIPGLVYGATVSQSDGQLERLEWLLGRADNISNHHAGGAEACLFQLFGVDIVPDQDVPVAAVTRVLDMGLVDNAWWIRADPVHLSPHGDTLVLNAGEGLAISQDEADQLVSEILDVFSGDGWVLKAPRPESWYLQLLDVPEIKTTPLSGVVGGDIYPVLPGGKQGKKWHTVLNELQIMLHTSMVNTQRESKGLPTINSLWLWGGGRLPVLKENDWVAYWGDDAVGSSLARLSGVKQSPQPASAENWLRESGVGNHLVVLNQAVDAKLNGQAESLHNFVNSFDEQWTEPLLKSIQTEELSSVTFVLGNCREYKANAKNLGRWWRRRIQISSLGAG